MNATKKSGTVVAFITRKEILMKKVNKKDLIIYLVIFLITVIIFFPLLKGHYATDSYNIFHLGFHKYALEYSLILINELI